MLDETVDPAIAEDLKELDDVWNAGKIHQRDDQPIGLFQVSINSATLGRSQSSNRQQITYTLEILHGEHKGKVISKYDGLETPQQVDMAQRSLASIGINAKAMTAAQLPATLVSLTGKEISVQAKMNRSAKGEFYNIYFRKPKIVTPAGSKKKKKGF